MAVGFSNTNKPINPRGLDASPKGYNRAALYSGKALDFDGVNDNVALYDATAIWTGDFSVSWYGDLDATGNFFAFSSGTYTATGQAGINFWYGGASNKNFSAHFPETDGTGQQGYNLTLAESYEYWHRIDLVFVSSSRLLSLYQNGILVDTATIASNVDATYMPNGWEFGRSYGGSFPLNGKLTNLKAFNVALTPAQVSDLYNNPEKIVPTGVDNTALKLWLPMMEGAGTTAYDGSGNGNHGTISGATWTHGVGSPVAQTAVIDWNKGTNIIVYSQEFESPNWIQASGGTGASVSVTENYGISPSGYQDAYRIQISTGSGGYGQIYQSQGIILGATYTVSVYLKSLNGNVIVDLGWFNGAETNFPANVTEEWQRFTYTFTDTANVCYPKIAAGFTSSNNIDVLAYGYQIEQASSVGPYVRTGATAQTTPVLLPQGLTSGRDITGVNLFENVRKQGALNLDGNSWAEVHDNASLDITDAITLEAWVYWDGTANNDGVLGRWFSGATSYMIYAHAGQLLFYTNTSSSAASISGTGWKHVIGTYDLVTRRMYIDGQEIGSGTAYNSPLATSDKPIEIGKYGGSGAAASYQNQIAQPRIYNRALTAEEVLRNYNSEKNTYQ